MNGAGWAAIYLCIIIAAAFSNRNPLRLLRHLGLALFIGYVWPGLMTILDTWI